MSVESIEVNVNPKEYFKKMQPEDAAEITKMCLDLLCAKADELKDLYIKLAKTFSVEMGIADLTLLVQVSSPHIPITPVRGAFGTTEGIKHALENMMIKGVEDLAKMKKEKDDEDIH